MKQLQPDVRQLNHRAHQPAGDLQRSFVNESRTELNRSDLVRSHGNNQGVKLSSSAVPAEESSKLNLLIEEYRRENDRCSKRINELQRKLNATANRK